MEGGGVKIVEVRISENLHDDDNVQSGEGKLRVMLELVKV